MTSEKTSKDIRSLSDRYHEVRNQTVKLCETLQDEDFVVQPVVDVSPPKWHLAHTTWFFETFVLQKFRKEYKVFDEQYNFLFNSYYESVGQRTVRAERGYMTRPTVKDIFAYRAYVDDQLGKMLRGLDEVSAELSELLTLGMQHEQQHQELMLYDIKRIFGGNPIFPVYRENIDRQKSAKKTNKAHWLKIDEGLYSVGREEGESGFSFDNESGRHQVYLQNYEIQSRLVTNGEFQEFIEADGYKQFNYWLMEGWEWLKKEEFRNPAYWFHLDGEWVWYNLRGGLQKIDMDAPVTHVSFYEADAYARWKGCRLPTEFEWETAALHYSPKISELANFVEKENYMPLPATDGNNQFFGDVWEWTNSSYLPYPYFDT
ncbi:MAG: ergothioneine biosynthesis protein EgtB, partial [Cyclobacteriaceae bacterium]